MKYILNIALIIIVFYSCNSYKEQENTGQSRSLPVIELELDSITLYTEYPARIEGKVNVDIRTRIDGYIQAIYVEEGAYVKAGQILFKIDDRTYTEALNSANAQLANAELEVNKYRMLSQNNVTSDFQLKTAEATYKIAKSAAETARINLNFTTVKAPVNGFIGLIPKRIGNLVSSNDTQPLTTLSDINEVYTYFSMSEKDFLLFNSQYQGASVNEKIAKMENVSLVLADNSIYPSKGKIDMVNGSFDEGTGAISMRATFENTNRLLRTGNTGRIIIPRKVSNILLVPVLSTMDLQNKILVWRLTGDNKAERISITISGKQGDFYIVKEGIKAGDRIVAKELETVIDGETIQPEIQE
ncbi:MAG: efflux RND transporter periplasmic adaptor subunit [Dysgonomonas sp.]